MPNWRPAAAALIYVAVLHYSYQALVSPSFAYAGYRYRDPRFDYYLYATLIVVIVALVMPRRIERPSQFILWVLYVVVAVPSIVVPQYAVAISPSEATILGLVVGFSFSAVALASHRPPSKVVPTPRLSVTSFWILIWIISGLAYGYLMVSVGLSVSLVGLTEVYDVRGDYKAELAAGGGVFAGYLLPLQANVVNPLIAARGITGRRWLLVVAALAGQFVLYASTGFKTVLFSIPFLMLTALLFRRGQPSGHVVVFGAIGASLAAMGLDRLLGGVTWTSLWVRRFLLTPGLLTAAYVATFDNAPKLHLGHSLLTGIVDYPYSVGPSLWVGTRFFDAPGMSANANVFADGYANFGYVGVVVSALALSVALWVIDGASLGIPLPAACLIVLMPTISLANSAMLTTLATHGLLAAMILLALAPRHGWNENHKAARPASNTGWPSSAWSARNG